MSKGKDKDKERQESKSVLLSGAEALLNYLKSNTNKINASIASRLPAVLGFNPSQVQFTRYSSDLYFNITNVSIPHRFNSHELAIVIQSASQAGFNPSQVQFTQERNIHSNSGGS